MTAMRENNSDKKKQTDCDQKTTGFLIFALPWSMGRILLLGQQVKIWNLWMGHLLVNRPDPLVKMASLTNRLICWPITPTYWPTKILDQSAGTHVQHTPHSTTSYMYSTSIHRKPSAYLSMIPTKSIWNAHMISSCIPLHPDCSMLSSNGIGGACVLSM